MATHDRPAGERPAARRPTAEEYAPRTSAGDLRRAQRHESHASGTWREFLKNLASLGGFTEDDAERYAVSVLCVLEQRIVPSEARDLEAQLPQVLRQLLQRCPRHLGAAPQHFGREEMFRMIAADENLRLEEVEHVVRSVLTAVRALISEGEAEDVASQLPKDIRDLWQRP